MTFMEITFILIYRRNTLFYARLLKNADGMKYILGETNQPNIDIYLFRI